MHVFDLLGCGLSERPSNPEVNASVSGKAPMLEGLMTHWGLNEANVVSRDIGGAVEQRSCVLSPSRVRSLRLIEVVSFDSLASSRTLEQMQEGLDLLIGKPGREHREHIREWLLSTANNKRRLSESALDTFLDFISGPVGQAGLLSASGWPLRLQVLRKDREPLGRARRDAGSDCLARRRPVAGRCVGARRTMCFQAPNCTS